MHRLGRNLRPGDVIRDGGVCYRVEGVLPVERSSAGHKRWVIVTNRGRRIVCYADDSVELVKEVA